MSVFIRMKVSFQNGSSMRSILSVIVLSFLHIIFLLSSFFFVWRIALLYWFVLVVLVEYFYFPLFFCWEMLSF